MSSEAVKATAVDASPGPGESVRPKGSALSKFKAVAHTIKHAQGMHERIIDSEVERKPRFDVTDEGDFHTNIVQEHAITTTSSLIGRFLGRSHQNLGAMYGKFCSSTDVAFKGPLMKQGSWWRSWKERFFVLRKDVPLLGFYSSESTVDTVLGNIMLHTSTTVTKVAPSEADYHPFAFRVETPEHCRKEDDDPKNDRTIPASTLLVHAKSDEEVNIWASEIKYQASVSTQKRRYKNAELNWWGLLFNDREVKSFTVERRRKGVLPSFTDSGRGSNMKVGGGGASHVEEGTLPNLSALIGPSHLDSRVNSTRHGSAIADKGQEINSKSKLTSRDIDSDYEDDNDDENNEVLGIQDVARSTEMKKTKGDRVTRLLTKKKQKLKKEKPPLPPPFERPDVSKYLTQYSSKSDYDNYRVKNVFTPDRVAASAANGDAGQKEPCCDSPFTAIEGIQVCLELKNMCYSGQMVYVVLLGYSHDKGNDSSNKCFELSRTETITVTDTAEYSLNVPVLHLHFSVMQFNIPDSIDDIYASVNREDGGESTLLTDSMCQVRFSRKMFESNTVFCTNLKVLSTDHIDLTNPQLNTPSGKIGILRLSSTDLYNARSSLGHTLRLKPYSEVMYALKTTNGVTMALDQLFASQYSVFASKSLVKLLMKEREPTINHYMRLMEEHKSDSEVKLLTSDTALHEHATVLHLEKIALTVHDEQLCDMQDVLDFYRSILVQGSGIDDNDDIANILSADQGGCYLRRSAWKKLSLWQYCCTNLNIHMLTTSSVSHEQILHEFNFDDLHMRQASDGSASTSQEGSPTMDPGERPSIRTSINSLISDNPEQKARFQHMQRIDNKATIGYANDMAHKCHFSYLRSVKFNATTFNFNGEDYVNTGKAAEEYVGDHIHFVPFITLGVPAAHGLGFDQGGLRRMLAGVTDEEHRIQWIHAIQHPSMGPIMSMRSDHPVEFGAIFGKHANFDNQENDFGVMMTKFSLAKRIDMVSSQVLGFACTSIRTIVALAGQQPESIYAEMVRVALKVGWLLTLTSLLSTSGDELGMIEDLEVASLWLRDVKLRFVDGTHADVMGSTQHPSEDRIAGVQCWRNAYGQLIIDLELTDSREVEVIKSGMEFWVREEVWRNKQASGGAGTTTTTEEDIILKGVQVGSATLASSRIPSQRRKSYLKPAPSDGTTVSADEREPGSGGQDGQKHGLIVLTQIDMFCIAFSVGVNEMQSIANTKSVIFVGAVQTQADINRASFESLKGYWGIYQHWWLRLYNYQGIHTYGTRCILAVQALFKDVEYAVQRSSSTPGAKHISVLTSISSFCRKLSGTIGILCKSGKDRTSMSVTLELTRAVVDAHNVIDGRNVVRSMRGYGVRRMNVWGNTGQPMFAFNSVQRSLLPECYRPPAGTFSGSVNS